ncbi:hypothetical protein, unknown function [Leishmania donovani]|uniref:Uncharacterized protein n=1 Tax=Leishmania donovani TaxID=5661 RepID=A0A3Q8IJF2_LEIDO|nr:hypothetical protein, unknown function [Leishmania donovani]AYU77831.1 hypothetical protein LdCL_170012600 [Leishmania donovani]TPP51696.1 hypothetical protein CGC21_3975 [Leishmania donovani]CBZ33216.1 hypothetical protein, unknown function [Leishmania donovani]
MASEDIIIFLDALENTVNSIRGDGSAKKTLFTTGCVCPDGVGLDLSAYKDSKNPDDIVAWWGNMGAMKPCPGQKDGADWHDADGFLVRAPLFGGDAAVKRVEMTAPRSLIRGTAAFQAPGYPPLVTTVKQVALSRNGRAVFFCDREGHGVKKYNVDTKEVVPLLSSDVLAALADGLTEEEARASLVEPNSDEDKCRFCVGITLDEKHNQIFFTLKGPSKGGKGRILAAPYYFQRRHLASITAANTSTSEGVIDPKTVVTLLDHLPEPIDLLLDSEENYLYWTDRGDDAAGGNSLNRAPVTYDPCSGQPQLGERELLIRGFNEAIGLAWAANLVDCMRLPKNKETLRQYMYVTDMRHLWRCDLKARTKEVVYKCGPRNVLTGVEVLRFF